MKRLLLAVGVWLVAFPLFAQAQIRQEAFIESPDPVALLNMQRFSTGILRDKAIHHVDAEKYDGQSSHDCNYYTFKQLNTEMYNAAVGIPITISTRELKDRVKAAQERNVVPISIINLQYDQIKPTAGEDGLLTFDEGQFKEVPNAPEPYHETKSVFATAVCANQIISNKVDFLIDQQFYISNIQEQPITIEVDFDDGTGFRQVNWGQTVTVNYPNGNDKDIKVRLRYQGATKGGNAHLKSAADCNDAIPIGVHLGVTPWPKDNISVPMRIWAPNLMAGSGVVKGNSYIWWRPGLLPNNVNNRFKKPLIFLEGIDFGVNGTHNEYNHLGDIGWCTMWGGDPTYYPVFNDMPDILNALHDRGYDVIMLDFKDGATTMERNAMVLIELLKRINDYKTADAEPTVVVGGSMGGATARTALAYMEQQGIDHCSRLFMSWDSPQQIASVPMGIQHAVWFYGQMAGLQVAQDILDDQLNRPATHELLVQHYNGAATTLRNQWNNTKATLGYPEKLRKVALSNGDGYGGNLMSHNSEILEISDHDFMNIWAQSGGTWVDNGGWFSGSTTYNNVLFRGRFPTSFFLGIPSSWIGYLNYSGTSPYYDSYPGGYRNTAETIKNEVSSVDGIPPVDLYEKYHCFIPTISALDLNTSNYNFNVSTLNYDYPGAITPFDAIYAPLHGNNEPHMFVNSVPGQNVDWVLKQIFGGENTLTSPHTAASLSADYNYGRPESNTFYSVNINSGGTVYVNGNVPVDYGVDFIDGVTPSNPPVVGSTLEMHTGACGADVVIGNNGELIIGDNSTGNKGIVHFDEGSTLTIQNGGKLIIHNNSRLIIEDGATLFFEEGAEIQLLGDEAVLEFKGGLNVGPNATFTFTFPGANSGYVRFDIPWQPTHPIVGSGNNSRVRFLGQSRTDKILEIADGDAIFDNGFQQFRFAAGTCVFLNSNARLAVATNEYYITSSNFEGVVGGRALHTYGAPTNSIVNCKFDKARLHGELQFGGGLMNVTNSEFFNGAYIRTYGAGVKFINVDIRDANVGWESDMSWLPQTYRVSELKDNNYGIINYSYGNSLLADRMDIHNNLGGMAQFGGELQVKCSDIYSQNNNEGIYLIDGDQLNMSNWDGTGYNDISDEVGFYDLDLLNIDGGANDFQGGRVFGSMSYDEFSGPLSINAHANLWFSGFVDPNYNPSFAPRADVYTKPNPPIPPTKIYLNWPLAYPEFPSCNGGSPGGGGIPNDDVAFAECADCNEVNGIYFNGETTNEAILIATKNMELNDDTRDDFVALAMFHEIFTVGRFDYTDPKQQFLATYAYGQARKALQNCFATGKITRADNYGGFHQCVQQYIDILNDFQQPITAGNFEQQFKLLIDEAMIYHTTGKLEEAIVRLRAIDNCFMGDEHYRIIRHHLDMLDVERQVAAGMVAMEQAYMLYDRIPKLEFDVPELPSVDPTANVHPNATLGSDVTVGANSNIGDGVVIEDKVTIGNNVTIEQGATIGSGTVVEDNARIARGVEVGDKAVIGNGATLERDVRVGDYAHVMSGALITKEVHVTDGSYIGKDVEIAKEVKMGSNVVIREGATIEKTVAIGNNTLIGKGTLVKKEGNIGAGVTVRDGITVGQRVTICDDEVVDTNVGNNGQVGNCNIPSSPTAIDDVKHNEQFAIANAEIYGNFFNGFEMEPLKVIVGEQVTFTASEASKSYAWDFGDCNVTSGESATHKYLKAGIYVVTLEQKINCASQVKYGAITVYPNPKNDIKTSIPLCITESSNNVSLSREKDMGDGSAPDCSHNGNDNTYKKLQEETCRVKSTWDFGTGSTLEETHSMTALMNNQDAPVTCGYDDNGWYHCTLTSSLEMMDRRTGDWMTTDIEYEAQKDIEISNMLKANYLVQTVCAPNEIQYLNAVEGGTAPYNYEWTFSTGDVSIDSDPRVAVANEGMLTSAVVVVDVNGCTTSKSQEDYIVSCGSTNSGAVEGEEAINANAMLPLLSNDAIGIYPNPNKGAFIVTLDNINQEGKATIEVYDMVGKVIYSNQQVQNNRLMIDISDQPVGVYLVRVVSGKHVATKRMVKQ